MEVFVAVTSGDRKVFIETAESVLKNTHVLRDHGHKVKVYFNFNDCQISRSRNLCSQLFLKSNADKMISVDWDIGFDDDAMLKLVSRNVDWVTGQYPQKIKDLERYSCCIKTDEGGYPVVKDGLMQATMTAIGFSCLTRKVFDDIIASGQVKMDHTGLYNFTDIGMIEPDNNNWYGEDVALCNRWARTGGEMWIEPDINFTHTGLVQFTGNMHRHFLQK